MHRMTVLGFVLAAGCAFPGLDPADLSTSYSPQDPGGGGGMLFVAYQADGVRDGQPVTVSHALVSFGEAIPNAERFESGNCVGFRATKAPGVVFPGRDAGALRITGGNDSYTCERVNGSYDCGLPASGGFFGDGARLTLSGRGGMDLGAFSSAIVTPPRAPVPDVDLATLARSSGEVRVGWTPSNTSVPMTCLQLQTYSDDGFVNGYVQCDVDDASGAAVVPASVAAALDRNAARTRVSLFSVDGSELMGTDGQLRAAFFGRGRFSEVVRTP